MKSVGVSLEFYMILCDWTLALSKDIKNIDVIQPSVTPGLLSSHLSNWSGGIADPLPTYDPNLLYSPLLSKTGHKYKLAGKQGNPSSI